MYKRAFIFLSDIHFYANSGNPADINNDIRNAILQDIIENAKISLGTIDGILVGGDIAFSGQKHEYEVAKDFLDSIADSIGIPNSGIFCVPGNHDVDQSIAATSPVLYSTQQALDAADAIDKVDELFEKYVNDPAADNILFKAIENYNDFAKQYSCDFHLQQLNWKGDFELDFGLTLRLHGMNSCYISNKDDRMQGEGRPMYIGQSQLPLHRKDVVYMTICHHPPEIWKFKGNLEGRLNKRAAIQLFGHQHTQEISLSEDNLIIKLGATHPVRKGEWKPSYCWLTVESSNIETERSIDLCIFPRVLSEDRDAFIADPNYCKEKNYICHSIPIDKKRKRDLSDGVIADESLLPIPQIETKEPSDRELIYRFCEVPFIKQTEILLRFSLLDSPQMGTRYSTMINDIIKRARTMGIYNDFRDAIMGGIR